MKKKVKFSFYELLLLVIVVAVSTGICSGLITYKMYNNKNNYTINEDDESLFKEFTKAYETLISNYYGDIDKKKLIEGAIDGMTSALNDPYTSYLNEEETKALFGELSGRYTGVGIRIAINENNQMQIFEIIANTPASKSELKQNDIIISINGTKVESLTTAEASGLIKNSEEKEITFEVLRGEETLTIKVNKEDNLMIPSVVFQEIDNNGEKIGYLYLSTFSQTTSLQVEEKLKEINEKGITKLVLDVRGNAGGFLTSADEIASQFIEKGKIIYQIGTDEKKEIHEDETVVKQDLKIVSLIDGGSASASEILVSALKESYGIKTVGTKSFGKGKVQKTSTLSDGSTVKYTTSYWYTPDGNNIDGKGITPDYEVVIEENTVEDIQLLKAIEVLNAQ